MLKVKSDDSSIDADHKKESVSLENRINFRTLTRIWQMLSNSNENIDGFGFIINVQFLGIYVFVQVASRFLQ